jgi:squalene-hopene/tetraprenyl-beta-curcumene cyclase
MTRTPIHRQSSFAFLVLVVACPVAQAGEESISWKPEAAAKYLDERQNVWFGHAKCVSCHTGLPYALARPALGKLTGTKTPSPQQTRLLDQIQLRVANWKNLDTKEFGLYYDASDQLKKQSWGTEAVFNAIILAFEDRYQGKSSPSETTKQAFLNLWQTQVSIGDDKGSWEWLDFSEAPWGNIEARYFGAALAAIAVGTAPGYYAPGIDLEADTKVKLLQGYLKNRFPKQNLHNQAWGLWADSKIGAIFTKVEQQKLIYQLLAKQQDDGGWSLPSLGTWVRNDRTPQEAASDGYSTALVLHVLQTAGVPKNDARIAKGLVWLNRNQSATGAWRSVSLVKKRDPASHTGKFMPDAATAFAVLALTH